MNRGHGLPKPEGSAKLPYSPSDRGRYRDGIKASRGFNLRSLPTIRRDWLAGEVRRRTARAVHFEITADDPERAAKFDKDIFGWSARRWEGLQEYWPFTTGDEKEPRIDGGLARRDDSPLAQSGTNTIDVASVDGAIGAVKTNGGEILVPKSAVPGSGWLSYFKDTEGNMFGMMKADESTQQLTVASRKVLASLAIWL